MWVKLLEWGCGMRRELRGILENISIRDIGGGKKREENYKGK